jgi:hypothetical protein
MGRADDSGRAERAGHLLLGANAAIVGVRIVRSDVEIPALARSVLSGAWRSTT